MAQLWRVFRRRTAREPRPLDGEALERLALHYVGRYATTKARLASYLQRKLAERGSAGPGAAEVDRLVIRFESLGYLDDAAFASARAGALGRRGYGERRVRQALRAAGVEEDVTAGTVAAARPDAWNAALRFAERKRIGPFAETPPDRAARQRAFAAMMRAGHGPDLASRIVNASPGAVPEPHNGLD